MANSVRRADAEEDFTVNEEEEDEQEVEYQKSGTFPVYTSEEAAAILDANRRATTRGPSGIVVARVEARGLHPQQLAVYTEHAASLLSANMVRIGSGCTSVSMSARSTARVSKRIQTIGLVALQTWCFRGMLNGGTESERGDERESARLDSGQSQVGGMPPCSRLSRVSSSPRRIKSGFIDYNHTTSAQPTKAGPNQGSSAPPPPATAAVANARRL
jgi:hypothetical protein